MWSPLLRENLFSLLQTQLGKQQSHPYPRRELILIVKPMGSLNSAKPYVRTFKTPHIVYTIQKTRSSLLPAQIRLYSLVLQPSAVGETSSFFLLHRLRHMLDSSHYWAENPFSFLCMKKVHGIHLFK